MKRNTTLRLLLATLLILLAGAGLSIRWHRNAPADAAALRLVLNVPAHRLYVYENGQHTRTYRVSVGLPGYQTPAGTYRIRKVIWNPWWHPPASGWARGRKPEAPGPGNPMGRVKLNFAPLLYLHGTSQRDVLGDPASHGCVRMFNPDLIELTRLVHSHLTPDVSSATLDELERNTRLTRSYNLPQGIPFEVIYRVASVRDGFLLIYPDVYKRVEDYREKVLETLRAEGVDLARVNWGRLQPLLEKGRRTKVAIPLDELLTPDRLGTPAEAGAGGPE